MKNKKLISKAISLFEYATNNWDELTKEETINVFETIDKDFIASLLKPPLRDIVVENNDFIINLYPIYKEGFEDKTIFHYIYKENENMLIANSLIMLDISEWFKDDLQMEYFPTALSASDKEISEDGSSDHVISILYLHSFLYHQTAERILRTELKNLLSCLLSIKGELKIKNSLPKGKTTIIEDYKDKLGYSKCLDMDIKKIEQIKYIFARHELDKLQWGEIIRIVNTYTHKVIIDAIMKRFDSNLRNCIAHGKFFIIRSEDGVQILYGDKKISFSEYFNKSDDLEELDHLFLISRRYSAIRYIIERNLIN